MTKRNYIFYIAVCAIFLGTKTTLAGVENSCSQPTYLAPFAETIAATSTTKTSTQFMGKVNANNVPTTYWFEYGISKNLNSNTGFIYAGKNNHPSEVAISANDLVPNTTYFYKIVAQNSIGTSTSEILSFKTNN